MDLKEFNTSELVEELKERDGVQTIYAEPYQDVEIAVNGPACVFIVTD